MHPTPGRRASCVYFLLSTFYFLSFSSSPFLRFGFFAARAMGCSPPARAARHRPASPGCPFNPQTVALGPPGADSTPSVLAAEPRSDIVMGSSGANHGFPIQPPVPEPRRLDVADRTQFIRRRS